jgi:hypothetical protein
MTEPNRNINANYPWPDPARPLNTPEDWVAPPINSVAPAITGTATVGQVLTCSTGTWSGSPTYSYQWKRDNTTNIGTNSSTYTLVAGDSTHNVGCVVTATNTGGSATATAPNRAIT